MKFSMNRVYDIFAKETRRQARLYWLMASPLRSGRPYDGWRLPH